MRRRALLALTLLPAVAQAQPTTIRLVIAFPPGGSTDILGRLLAPRMAARLGALVTPENRSGAGGAVASGHVAHSAPDGGTLLLDSGGQAVNPALMRGLGFDYARDLAPVTLLATLPLLLVARPGFGVGDLPALVERLRADPRHARYGSVGVGSRTHIAAAALLRRAGVAGEHVPYRGGADQVQGMLRGDVPFGFTSLALAAPLLADGRLRALGVSTATRAAALPEVKTIAEQGLPGFAHGDWVALLVPTGTPEAAIARLAEAAAEAMGEVEIAPRLAAIGLQPEARGPAHLAGFLAEERALMARIIAEEDIRLD
ncbi:Bug family tripartite tricarboxylate transporter substrate binding protein [Roseococcus suduntuyensis]|uniref:Tripartite-type tricarboxylate transporter receptor subunit TctC n=1 Tax=Roseococcus suduntuyensis TaxID=455361 RepID=A0A840AGM4_9PROT|nr:tripartite tricarboxylate transporter substrate-binding protein [Roseococcus suduntuyensis]MBB3899640.1 tripartite-type tricarboxylate transporter receptor subunit TctC [Roseococcus suduntuyensis]